jgi:hypothetical protein
MDFSLVSAVFDTLRIVPPPRLILLEARTLASAHVPPYPARYACPVDRRFARTGVALENCAVDDVSEGA